MREKHGAGVDYSKARNPSSVQFHLAGCNFLRKSGCGIPNGKIIDEVE
jgi:hypothetical protein